MLVFFKCITTLAVFTCSHTSDGPVTGQGQTDGDVRNGFAAAHPR